MAPLPLRAAVKRGLLLAAANWPIVLIDFAVESLARLAVFLPVVGGALMVTALAGIDLRSLLSEGIFGAADLVVASLTGAPAALVSFLAAVAIVLVGSEVLQFVVKGGTLAVLVRADRSAGAIERLPIGSDVIRRARAFDLGLLIEAGRRLTRRGFVVSLWLGLAYAVVAASYLALVWRGSHGADREWTAAWSAVVLGATSAAVVAVAIANLAYTLLRVVIVTDDCGVGTAISRLRQFAVEDARQVIGVFVVIAAIELVAGAAALFVAAAVAPIAYVPVLGLLIVPLQAALWLLRALVLEAFQVAGVAAYQTQYRRFANDRWSLEVTEPSGTDADRPDDARG